MLDPEFGPQTIGRAARGEPRAVAAYGAFLLSAPHGLTDRAAGAELLHRVEADPHGMIGLGLAYEHGRAVMRDPAAARRWYRKAADAGAPEGHYLLGLMYSTGSAGPRDPAEAALEFRTAAEAGYAPAMVSLAQAYYTGEGVPPDAPQLLAWNHKAALLGNATAMTNMGILCAQGIGRLMDPAEARAWFLAAAQHGDIRGMLFTARAYTIGDGVARNDATAAYWLERAAEREEAPAMRELAGLYRFGRGVPSDKAKAAYWKARADRVYLRSNGPWAQKPTSKDLVQFYPARARRAGKSGLVVLVCTLQADGAVSDCDVFSESPPYYGFGEAALRMAPFFRMRLDTGQDGLAVGEEIHIPIHFGM